MDHVIKHQITGAVLFEGVAGMTVRQTLENATVSRTNLSRADLSRAKLSGADLSEANLYMANLSGAKLSGAKLSGANLSGANLSRAKLSGADLSRAKLSGADLSEADLSGADLFGADLFRANLSGAKNADLAIARTRIIGDGSLIGWKKCEGDVIVKLRVPEDAKRSHAFGRKCRAEFVDVIEVFGAEIGISSHDKKTQYKTGARVTPDSFSENWQEECANGIHFYLSRVEAENHY